MSTVSTVSLTSLVSGTSAGTSSTTSGTSLFADMLDGASVRTLEHTNTEDTSATSNAAQEFLDYMSKPWAERFMESWLKQHGISKEDFEQMSPEEQQKLLDQMKQDLEEEMKRRVEESNKTLLGL